MKLIYFCLGLIIIITAASCHTDEKNASLMQGKMQGEWRLDRITNLDDNSYRVSSEFHYPRITIETSDLTWKETYYTGSTKFQVLSKTQGTGEFECLEDEDGEIYWEEICETVHSTNIAFMYKRHNAESLILDPGKDSLTRTLNVSRIDIMNSTMHWEVWESGNHYEFLFTKVQ